MAVSSPSKPGGSRAIVVLIIVIVVAAVGYHLWSTQPDLKEYPTKYPDRYRQMVSAFTVAATKLKVGDKPKDLTNLAGAYKRPTEIVPDEPAGWANLALWYLRSSK